MSLRYLIQMHKRLAIGINNKIFVIINAEKKVPFPA